MNKFKFSLNKMRDYKKQLLEGEKNKLMKLFAERDGMQLRIQELFDDYELVHKKMSDALAKGVTIFDVKMLQYRIDSIRLEQQQLQIQINIIEGAIERQRRSVVSMSQEVSGLDKLEEKQRSEYDRLLAKEQELIISEFISNKLMSQAS